jgi:hypothetical protein
MSLPPYSLTGGEARRALPLPSRIVQYRFQFRNADRGGSVVGMPLDEASVAARLRKFVVALRI